MQLKHIVSEDMNLTRTILTVMFVVGEAVEFVADCMDLTFGNDNVRIVRI